MSATRLKTVKPTKATQEIEMQDASLDIWDKKYRLKDKNEQPVDKDINAFNGLTLNSQNLNFEL